MTGHGDEATIRDLISYRLSRAANLMSRGAALRYRREVDVSLGEWRALALLAGDVPLSLTRLARDGGLDKAQMSRVVTGLVARGLVRRESSSENARVSELSLTQSGRAIYAHLMTAAAERDRAFRAALEPEELQILESAIEKLADQARQFIRSEVALVENSGPD